MRGRDTLDHRAGPGDLQGGDAGVRLPEAHDHRRSHAGHHPHEPHVHPAHPAAHHHAPAVHEHNPQSLISARNLVLARGGRTILAGVDIAIRPREIVTVIGPNGAGKTTLIRALLGLEPLDQGEIRHKPGLVTGYAPQRFDVDPAIPLTVSRFVSLARPGATSELARVLEDVGAGDLASRQLSQLSGGELQRVVLARALIRAPDLLVLDEPVRGVDYAGEAELYTLIGRLRTERGLGVLLVSHDLHVVMAQSDRVICLNRHVCCSGVPQSVAQHPEYARLFGPQAARAFGLYHHHHDHSHDLAGEPQPPPSGRT
jgi:zinc transport system ATP-binding protein